MHAFTCDGCDRELSGERVVFSTEATDADGVDVTVAKRWVTCRTCADALFERIGRPSPWADDDTVMVLPDDQPMGASLGGHLGRVGHGPGRD